MVVFYNIKGCIKMAKLRLLDILRLILQHKRISYRKIKPHTKLNCFEVITEKGIMVITHKEIEDYFKVHKATSDR